MTTKSTVSELPEGKTPPAEQTLTPEQFAKSGAKSVISKLDEATTKTARVVKPMASSDRVLKKAMVVDGVSIDKDLSGNRVLLTVFGSKDAGGEQAVSVGLNGFMYQIPRDTPCNVPEEVAMVINDAVERIYDYKVDGRDSKQAAPRDIHRFAFRAIPVDSAMATA